MYRVYGEYDVTNAKSDLGNIVDAIKDYELECDLNPVPNTLILKKLGIKVDTTCEITINGRDFSVNANEALEFGYDTISVNSIVFKTPCNNAVVRYMYYREDMMYR